MTKPSLPCLCKALFLSANAALKWDPHLAKIYYQQRVKHYSKTKALCTVMARLADQIRKVFKEDRDYIY